MDAHVANEGTSSETKDAKLDHNLYYNGGTKIPIGTSFLQAANDIHAVFGDPLLGDPSNPVVPRWVPEQHIFFGGSTTIREEFERLVRLYGMPGPGSLALGAADPKTSASEDILGLPRKNSPDIGACETQIN